MPYFKGHDFIIKNSGRPEEYFIGQALVYPENDAVQILNKEFRSGISPKEITSAVYKNVAGRDELTKKQYLDMKLWLPGRYFTQSG